MESICKKYNDFLCFLDLTVLYKKWNNTYFITKYDNTYNLCKIFKGNIHINVKIVETQAHEIIKQKKLTEVHSTLIGSVSVFKMKNTLNQEIILIEDLLTPVTKTTYSCL